MGKLIEYNLYKNYVNKTEFKKMAPIQNGGCLS